jgi:hypothetical protein
MAKLIKLKARALEQIRQTSKPKTKTLAETKNIPIDTEADKTASFVDGKSFVPEMRKVERVPQIARTEAEQRITTGDLSPPIEEINMKDGEAGKIPASSVVEKLQGEQEKGKIGGVNFTGIGKTGIGIPLDKIKPEVLKQIHADQDAAYGYLPNKGTPYDKPYYDFKNVKWAKKMRRIRIKYLKTLRQIEKTVNRMLLKGTPRKDIADYVVKTRNQQKVKARKNMDPVERAGLEERNIKKYGNPIGPNLQELFESIKESYIEKGIYKNDDQIYDIIIQKAMDKDEVINILLGILD